MHVTALSSTESINDMVYSYTLYLLVILVTPMPHGNQFSVYSADKIGGFIGSTEQGWITQTEKELATSRLRNPTVKSSHLFFFVSAVLFSRFVLKNVF